jgi:hypothetical protein
MTPTRDTLIIVGKQKIEQDVPELRRAAEFLSVFIPQIVQHLPHLSGVV